MTYVLSPKEGWEKFFNHKDIIDRLFSSLIPLVNQGKLNYYNLTSQTSIFEDLNGNYVYLYFSSEANIVELKISDQFAEKTMQEILDDIKIKFDLEQMKVDL